MAYRETAQTEGERVLWGVRISVAVAIEGTGRYECAPPQVAARKTSVYGRYHPLRSAQHRLLPLLSISGNDARCRSDDAMVMGMLSLLRLLS